MSHVKQIHAVILTLDEGQHIKRCIESLHGQCDTITVIDSGSRDETVSIARGLGAEVVVNPWVNYATQMNFGIDYVANRGGWLLRIDADEVLDRDSGGTLRAAIERVGDPVDALLVQRRIYFLGRRIRYGAIEPSWQLRVWRNGCGRCEQRWMDEHILVGGQVAKSELIFSDINLNSLTWWTAKHNSYASREAIDILNLRHGLLKTATAGSAPASPQARRRRFVKEKIYSKLSPGGRAFLYFLYRYVLRLGFLDGRAGFYFHLMQGLWYRTLVDAKVIEIEQCAHNQAISIASAIKSCTGIAIEPPGAERANVELKETKIMNY